MTQEFIPYEQALELKELGFDEDVFEWFDAETKDFCDVMKEIKAPLYQQAFRWFRKKNYDVAFRKMDYGNDSVFTGYYYTIYKGMEMIDLHGADKRSKTYEEAELACLRKLIEIVKQK